MSLKLGSNDTTLSAGSSVVKQMLLGSSPKFAAPVLDHVPGAAAAYSLRRLSNAYTGPVVKVRRSSDSTTADFTAGEVVDGTLIAWVGAGDGFVDTWYDQSGNARNAVQATAGYQPKVVSSGVLVTEGGKPALQFATTNAVGLSIRLQTAAFATPIPQPATAFLVSTNRTTDDRQIPFDGRVNQFSMGWNVDTGYKLSAGAIIESATSINTNTNLFSGLFNGGSSELLIDGALAASGNAGANELDGISIGNIRGAPGVIANNYTFIGTISELIVYPSDVSASRELAEGEMAWHYGLQSKLPYNHAYAPQALGGASQTVPTDSDATAYLAAVAAADGAAVERSVAVAIDDFVKGLKADGLWSAIGASCVLAGARTVAGALVPLKGAAPTGYNWVASDYSRSLGLKGDGSTKYIDSNRANDADPEADKHLAVYATIIASIGKGGYIGGYTSSPAITSQIIRAGSASTVSAALNDATGSTVASTSAGLIGASRLSTAFSLRADGVTTGSTSSTVSGLTSNALVFARNGDGSPVFYSDARLSFYSVGASVDLALLDARVTALMTAIGAAL